MRRLITLVAIGLIIYNTGWAQGIEFFKGSWEEALATAKEQDRVIFVDAYAVWCGPCKKMDRTVFTQAEVGEFFNNNFINVKMDMERGQGIPFGRKYPVSAYPTLMFIDYSGQLVKKAVGGRNPEALIKLAKEAMQSVDRSGKFAEAYEKGDRDPELVYNYIKALNKANKSSLKIANQYLREKKDLQGEMRARILFEGLSQLDSRLYTLFNQSRSIIDQYYTSEEIDEQVTKAGRKTVMTGVEFNSLDLLEEAKSKVREQCSKAEATRFEVLADLNYSLGTGDEKIYAKGIKKYLKSIAPTEDPSKINNVARNGFREMRGNKKIVEVLEKVAETAASRGNHYNYFITYAQILDFSGKKSKAIAALEEAEGLAKEEGQGADQMVRQYLERLEEGR